MRWIFSLPYVGNENMVAQIEKLQKTLVMQFKIQMVTSDFRNTWYHDSKRFLYVNSLMSREEKDIFFMDLTQIDILKMSR